MTISNSKYSTYTFFKNDITVLVAGYPKTEIINWAGTRVAIIPWDSLPPFPALSKTKKKERF